MAQLVARSTPDRCLVGSSRTCGTEHFGFPPVLRDWVIKGLGMSSLVYATGHIKDPVPLIAKRRGLSPGGRFPPSFIHQVIIITGQNKLYNCMFSCSHQITSSRLGVGILVVGMCKPLQQPLDIFCIIM